MSYSLASAYQRDFGAIIDMSLATLPGLGVASLALPEQWELQGIAGAGIGIGAGLAVTMLVLMLKDVYRSVSPGRYIANTTVRCHDDPDALPRAWQMAVRNALLLIWPIELIVFLANKDRRRIGDFLAGTTVVRREGPAIGYRIALGAAVIVGSLFAMPYAFIPAMEKTAAYQQAAERINNSERVAQAIGKVQEINWQSGQIQMSSGSGIASMRLRVSGSAGSTPVALVLEKKPGTNWELSSLRL